MYGWMPPEFLVENTPDNPFPIPVPDREVHLEEKYAALAAIHDYTLKGTKKIDPWGDNPREYRGGISYRHALMPSVANLDEEDENSLWEWLKDLEKELRVVKPADFPAIVETPAHLRDGGLMRRLTRLEEAILQVSENMRMMAMRLRPPILMPPSGPKTARDPQEQTMMEQSARDSTAAGEKGQKRPMLGRTRMQVDEGARLVFWDQSQLQINAHADFEVLRALCRADGRIASHLELVRSIKPKEFAETVERISIAAPEVKDAVTHIRAAFRKAECTGVIQAVKGQGYRLRFPDE